MKNLILEVALLLVATFVCLGAVADPAAPPVKTEALKTEPAKPVLTELPSVESGVRIDPKTGDVEIDWFANTRGVIRWFFNANQQLSGHVNKLQVALEQCQVKKETK